MTRSTEKWNQFHLNLPDLPPLPDPRPPSLPRPSSPRRVSLDHIPPPASPSPQLIDFSPLDVIPTSFEVTPLNFEPRMYHQAFSPARVASFLACPGCGQLTTRSRPLPQELPAIDYGRALHQLIAMSLSTDGRPNSTRAHDYLDHPTSIIHGPTRRVTTAERSLYNFLIGASLAIRQSLSDKIDTFLAYSTTLKSPFSLETPQAFEITTDGGFLTLFSIPDFVHKEGVVELKTSFPQNQEVLALQLGMEALSFLARSRKFDPLGYASPTPSVSVFDFKNNLIHSFSDYNLGLLVTALMALDQLNTYPHLPFNPRHAHPKVTSHNLILPGFAPACPEPHAQLLYLLAEFQTTLSMFAQSGRWQKQPLPSSRPASNRFSLYRPPSDCPQSVYDIEFGTL